MKTVTLPVKGLNFAGCAREIEKHLSKLDGIAQAEASYVSQTVTVTYDDTRLSVPQLRERIKDCGFLCGEPWSETSNPALSAHLSTGHTTKPQAASMPRWGTEMAIIPLRRGSLQPLPPLDLWKAWHMRDQQQHLQAR